MLETAQFLQTWGALIVAFVALAQPWVSAAYRRLYLAPNIVIEEVLKPEIGFSAFGPTLGLWGTLLGENESQFVTHMRAKVIRLKDGAQSDFAWHIARSTVFDGDGNPKVSGIVASAFVLEQDATFAYSVLMKEPSADSELVRISDQLQKDWQAFVAAQVGGVANLTDPAVQAKLQNGLESMYQEFCKQPEHVSSSAALDRLFCWYAGSYEVSLLVDVRRKEAPFEKKWRFTLTADDEQRLRDSGALTQRSWCGVATPGQNYYFAYPSYEKAA